MRTTSGHNENLNESLMEPIDVVKIHMINVIESVNYTHSFIGGRIAECLHFKLPEHVYNPSTQACTHTPTTNRMLHELPFLSTIDNVVYFALRTLHNNIFIWDNYVVLNTHTVWPFADSFGTQVGGLFR